ncbi:MAG: response regulator [Bdellovibrionales bacterium]
MAIKLVIADDAPFIREVIKQIAITHEMKVVGEASNGVEAVQLARSTQPDVIVMDLVMPDKNGIEAIREILDNQPQIKIIACSTMTNETILIRALKAGACDVVIKPFTQEKLLTAIKKATGYIQEPNP